MAQDPPKGFRETDDEARQWARTLISTARFGALAVLDPQTNFPNASRVLVCTAQDGTPIILISRLSAHTKALEIDPRCSILLGEPAKGDPLTWPRISIQCEAQCLDRQDEHYPPMRARFLKRHPKSKLYIDFADFELFRLKPVTATLNGGFGKAYALHASDIVIHI